MLQLLIELQFYGTGKFRRTVTGDLVNVSQTTLCRVVGYKCGGSSLGLVSTSCHRLVKFLESAADLDLGMGDFH